MNQDQSDWFELVADLIADYEASTEKKAKPLPVTKRLARLLEAHAMKAADLGRLLELEPSMGSKIINGTRQLTTAHIRKLARHLRITSWRYSTLKRELRTRTGLTTIPTSQSVGGAR